MAKIVPRKNDVSATVGMLLSFKDELFARMDERFNRIEARFDRVDARFEQVDARFEQVDARFEQVDARFAEMNAQFKEVNVEIKNIHAKLADVNAEMSGIKGMHHRTLFVIEEQERQNMFALDAARHTMEEMIGIKGRVQKLEDQDAKA